MARQKRVNPRFTSSALSLSTGGGAEEEKFKEEEAFVLSYE